MKNLLLTAVAGSAICLSCATAKTAQQNRVDYLQLKGNWQITSVDYDKSFAIRPFNENADAQCFVGSQWNLIPNNYTGSHTLNGGGTCPTVTQPIKFEVLNGNQFQFKKLVEGTKAKQVTSGYTLTLANRTENSFSLEQDVPFEGQIVKVIYNFVKVGK